MHCGKPDWAVNRWASWKLSCDRLQQGPSWEEITWNYLLFRYFCGSLLNAQSRLITTNWSVNCWRFNACSSVVCCDCKRKKKAKGLTIMLALVRRINDSVCFFSCFSFRRFIAIKDQQNDPLNVIKRFNLKTSFSISFLSLKSLRWISWTVNMIISS